MKVKSFSYNKYHVSPKDERTLDGIVFASKGEMNRYAELKLLERNGEIKNLTRQPRLKLLKEDEVEGLKALYYVGDFIYEENNRFVIEDFKGMETQLFKWKWRLAKEKYPKFIFKIIK